MSLEIGYHPQIKIHGQWVWPLPALAVPQTLGEALAALETLTYEPWRDAERRVTLIVRAETIVYGQAARVGVNA